MLTLFPFLSATALWSSASAIINDPLSIVNVLAISLPNLAIYFINWILLGIASVPIGMIVKIILRQLGIWWLSKGEGYPGEAKMIIGLTGWISAGFHTRVPTLLLMWTIALCYSSINPVRNLPRVNLIHINLIFCMRFCYYG